MGAKDSFMGRLLGSAGKFTDKQVAETLTLLIEHGVKRSASDIHIEPHERFVLVRYRIDGTLRGIHKLPRAALGVLMAQLKTAAGLDPQEVRIPQEAEYPTVVDGARLAIRLSTMPVFGGEKAVLHLTRAAGQPVDLSELGFWGEGLTALKSLLARPHGLILVSGPKHNGLSTTLFSLLQDVNSPMVSIATVETSMRQRLPGVSQTYLTAGMSTVEALRAALRQDPNIIMIDNLSDGQTAELAIHSATTGQLILAGLHADSSITAVLRLRHAGVEPFLLASGLRASIGQRLVRKLCPDCRERYTVGEAERVQLEASFGMTTPASRKRVHELERAAAPAIFGDVKQLGSTPAHITHLWRASESGCTTCQYSGYQGRTAIVEVLKHSDALHKMLLSSEIQTANAIQMAVLKEGFIPMGLDGLVKALRGQTTAAEVLRAIGTTA